MAATGAGSLAFIDNIPDLFVKSSVDSSYRHIHNLCPITYGLMAAMYRM